MFEKFENRMMQRYEQLTRKPTRREVVYLIVGFVIAAGSSMIKLTPKEAIDIGNNPVLINDSCIHDIKITSEKPLVQMDIYTEKNDNNGVMDLEKQSLDLPQSILNGKQVSVITLNTPIGIAVASTIPNGVSLDLCAK
ncbi:MAG: hypothetical protein WCK31_03020 [bacterium]